jgi:hypothetical protein
MESKLDAKSQADTSAEFGSNWRSLRALFRAKVSIGSMTEGVKVLIVQSDDLLTKFIVSTSELKVFYKRTVCGLLSSLVPTPSPLPCTASPTLPFSGGERDKHCLLAPLALSPSPDLHLGPLSRQHLCSRRGFLLQHVGSSIRSRGPAALRLPSGAVQGSLSAESLRFRFDVRDFSLLEDSMDRHTRGG